MSDTSVQATPTIIEASDMRQNKYYKTAHTKYEGYVKCDMCMHDLDGNLICKVENLITQNIVYLVPTYRLIEVSDKEAKEFARLRRIELGITIIAKPKIDTASIDTTNISEPAAIPAEVS